MAAVDGMLYMLINLASPATAGPAHLVLWQSDGTPEGTYSAGQEISGAAPAAAALAARHSDASGSAPSATSFAIASTEPVVRILGRKAFVQVTDAQDTPRLYVMDLRPAARPAQRPALVIKGTKGADKLYLSQTGDWLRYTLNGRTQRVRRSLFSTIEIRTSSGNDRILIGPGVTGVNADAGPGNDILIGTAAGNTLNGGAGNDLIIARSRANTLLGAAGNDILIAAGNDPRNGGAGKNRIYAKRLPNLPAITRPTTLFKLPADTSPAMLFGTVIEPRLAKRP
jgi:Ca2+-binding RTX toxin-like protein